jgi:hypothetical protein
MGPAHHCEPLHGPGPYNLLGIMCPGAATPTTPCVLGYPPKDSGKQVPAGTVRKVGGIDYKCLSGAWAGLLN